MTERWRRDHERKHRHKGDIPHNFTYVLQKVDELRVQSAIPLYSEILEYRRLNGMNGIEKPKTLEVVSDEQVDHINEDGGCLGAEYEGVDEQGKGEQDAEIEEEEEEGKKRESKRCCVK